MMNPYVSWAIVLLIAGGLGFYYSSRTPSRPRVSTAKPTSAEKSDYVSTNKKAKRRTRKPDDIPSSSAPVKQDLRVNTAQTTSPAADTGMDNLQFAREFSKVKKGDALSAAPSSNNKGAQNKSRSTKANKKSAPESYVSTSASSTTGADADDDLSPVDSPQETPIAATNDVSDMLEAPAPSASVLRVTGSVNNEPAKKKQNPESFKVAETKKQRQQRIKRENNRALVQEAEQQRRALLEKQLHSARGHERQEAAKSKPATTNAWAQTPTLANKTNGTQEAPAAPATLLDTFDAESTPPSTRVPETTNNSKSSAGGSVEKSWAQELPSEEEQMRMLSAMSSENEWTTVSKRKKEKKSKPGGDSMSEASSSEIQPSKVPQVQPAPAPALPSVTTSNEKGHPLDSDWPA